jgi:hypothetical protein
MGGTLGALHRDPRSQGPHFESPNLYVKLVSLNKSSKTENKNLDGGPKKKALHPSPKISLHGPAHVCYK